MIREPEEAAYWRELAKNDRELARRLSVLQRKTAEAQKAERDCAAWIQLRKEVP
jgi:hypothetical protein